MAYTIRNSDGTTLVLLADNTVDQSTTSLALVGKNVSAYGEYFNNNLIKLLTNSADTTANPPNSPAKGQLWYDISTKRLKVYDNGFKPISGAIVSPEPPAEMSTGDMWFDSTNNQLNVYRGSTLYLVGPAFPKSAGDNGWILPATLIKDTSSNSQQVTLLKSYGQFIGIISKSKFDMSVSDSAVYFNSPAPATVCSGLTIVGDIKNTGQITSNHLSLSVDIDKIAQGSVDVNFQNQKINLLLEKMFPSAANSDTSDVGVPFGSEARVICTYSLPTAGVQVRRFKIVNQPSVGISWQPYNVYLNGTSNVVSN